VLATLEAVGSSDNFLLLSAITTYSQLSRIWENSVV
jgi:hypothetical protein